MKDLIQNIAKRHSLGILQEIFEIHGGDSNLCFKSIISGKAYFVKINSEVASDFYDKEYRGLIEIANFVHVPKVYGYGENYLLQEFIEFDNFDRSGNINAAHQLANLHSCKSDDFGWIHNNYLGKMFQPNASHKDPSAFYIGARLKPLVEEAVAKGLLSREDEDKMDKLFKKIPEFLPREKASLVHGDLWAGNIGQSQDKVYFFDPSIHFGFREADLAMTRLFGGFSPSFYSEYNNLAPLLKGWEQRVYFFQIYPLLVHLHLFGKSYYTKLMQAVSAYL